MMATRRKQQQQARVSANVVPAWITKLVVGALIAALIGGTLTWAGSTNQKVQEHEKDLAVQKEAQQTMKENIAEIKADTREIKQMLRRR
jgi:hypothetical protein